MEPECRHIWLIGPPTPPTSVQVARFQLLASWRNSDLLAARRWIFLRSAYRKIHLEQSQAHRITLFATWKRLQICLNVATTMDHLEQCQMVVPEVTFLLLLAARTSEVQRYHSEISGSAQRQLITSSFNQQRRLRRELYPSQIQERLSILLSI